MEIVVEEESNDRTVFYFGVEVEITLNAFVDESCSGFESPIGHAGRCVSQVGFLKLGDVG